MTAAFARALGLPVQFQNVYVEDTVSRRDDFSSTVDKDKVTKDEVLAMIIIGKLPEQVSKAEMATLTT